MPYITFMWHHDPDNWRLGPIVDDLRAIASLDDINFYVNAEKGDTAGAVVVRKGTAIPTSTLERLHGLATKAGVTIYVDPPN